MFNRRPEGRVKQHCIVENGRMQVYHWERSVFRFGPMCEFCNGKWGKRHIKTPFGTRKELKRNKYDSPLNRWCRQSQRVYPLGEGK